VEEARRRACRERLVELLDEVLLDLDPLLVDVKRLLEQAQPLVLAHGIAGGRVVGDELHAAVTDLVSLGNIFVIDRPEACRLAVGEQHVRLDDLTAVLADLLAQHLDRRLEVREFLIDDRLVCGKRQRRSEHYTQRTGAKVWTNVHG